MLEKRSILSDPISFSSKTQKARTAFCKSCLGLLFLASLRGIEPPAYRLGGGRSIQLSYRDIYYEN
jgi:hypothetical protein